MSTLNLKKGMNQLRTLTYDQKILSHDQVPGNAN